MLSQVGNITISNTLQRALMHYKLQLCTVLVRMIQNVLKGNVFRFKLQCTKALSLLLIFKNFGPRS